VSEALKSAALGNTGRWSVLQRPNDHAPFATPPSPQTMFELSLYLHLSCKEREGTTLRKGSEHVVT